LFISLTTAQTPKTRGDRGEAGRRKPRDSGKELEPLVAERRSVPLQEALRHERLVVVGDPGAGKTTFLWRVAHALCQTRLGESPEAAQARVGIGDRTFPIFLKLVEWAQHMARHANHADAPAGEDAPAWLPHYLAGASQANCWGLDAEFFRQQLEGGLATVLLDGLDEAPDRIVRQRLSRLIESAARAYAGCRFVVTSRPAAYAGEVILPDFAHAWIDPLSDQSVDTFLTRWCHALYGEARQAPAHCQELRAALHARSEIHRMARNPVMLTALAVVHWNERRLPEQRADLYDSILRWLSRSREQRPGRATAERTLVLLQEVALAMQDDPQGRKIQVPKRWAAEKIAGELGAGPPSKETIQAAERFLDEEELDSGIVVARGSELAFWHLTFQEFLAAKAVASRLEADQRRILFSDPGRVYQPDWREVILLLAGILHEQGRAKVDWLAGTVLEAVQGSSALAHQARCAGLLGSIERDLQPLKYRVSHARYSAVLDAVRAIFDRDRSQGVPIEIRIAAADALGQAGDPRMDPKRDDYWIAIPAGKFLMGAQRQDPKGSNYDTQAFERESPVHEVGFDAYRIARYPVTVGQYRKFVEDDGYQDRRWWHSGGFGEFSQPLQWDEQVPYPSRPVVGVSWHEAEAYCAWAGYRLPTEAEWERAARGTEGRKYPWGNEPAHPSRLNFIESRIGHPTPVGIYPLGATPEGLCDMAGNVWEWCGDWHGNYAADAVSNPLGPERATARVIRGGSWGCDAKFCRAASRERSEPQYLGGDLGFRVAAVPPGR
jgi:formylglycine-generating enzyme required for sulfatase activity